MKRFLLTVAALFAVTALFAQTNEEILARMDAELATLDSNGFSMIMELKIPILGSYSTNMYTRGNKTKALVDVKGEKTILWSDSVTDWEYDVNKNELTISNAKSSKSSSDDSMSAVLTMSGQGYLYLFMGTGSEAVKADESSYIPYEETADGAYTFTVPVDALDEAISCAAYSKRKEQWYDRTLVFRADSLPPEALSDRAFTDPSDLNLADGTYTVEVTLAGGSGKASVSSPALLTVTDGKVTAEIIWSSSNYDFMEIDGVRYDPVNEEGNSTFVIPVTGFDYKMPVSADTTAMSTPHLIDYTLIFDSASVAAAE